MKLAACYTVFNGLELLEESINQIKDHVDEIIICYQNKSNTGNFNPDVNTFVFDLAKKFRNKMHVIVFHPDLSKNTKENERNKHQQMLLQARALDCTHFFLSATDHFYITEEFIFGKNTCQIQNPDVSFTKMYTYYKDPTWQLTPTESYYMPFIMRLNSSTKIARNSLYPVPTDPSVQVSPAKHTYVFHENDLILHHYSMIRNDIEDKFRNAAASIRWKQEQVKQFIDEYKNYNIEENPGLTYFQGRKIKVVENYFKL